MATLASFNYQGWVDIYPEFTDTVTPDQANLLFTYAQVFLDNTGAGVVQDLTTLTVFFNLIVAHLGQIQYGSSKRPATGQVGRIGSAGEGSVSVSFDFENGAGTQKFWSQTEYGAMYWAMTARYRCFKYISHKPRKNFV